jgi:hypothetical protein
MAADDVTSLAPHVKAVVTRVMPARQRVAVLLEFLGRQTAVELESAAVIREGDQRQGLL